MNLTKYNYIGSFNEGFARVKLNKWFISNEEYLA